MIIPLHHEKHDRIIDHGVSGEGCTFARSYARLDQADISQTLANDGLSISLPQN